MKSHFSQHWYRAATLRPCLRSHVRVHRQRFRRRVWYILEDPQNGAFFRVSSAAYWLICRMDGRRTVHEIWESFGNGLNEGDCLPTQDETIQLLSQMHSADLLAGGMNPDMGELTVRADRQTRREMLAQLKNPLAVRIPLIDPDRLLEATVPLVRWLVSPLGLVLWAGIVISGIVSGLLNSAAFAHDIVGFAFSAQNVAIAAAVYAGVKTVHELGHAWLIKAWGGEVHDMGIMLLLLVPVPYVNASASSAFSSKWRRALVAAAGIMVEAALASAAMILWPLMEPGLERAVAMNIVVIAGVSTLLFNGNPLLRFDGYYVLSEIIEIPNLGTRANRCFFYLIRRFAFGIRDEDSPAADRGEARWLLFYAVASFIYRQFIMFTIALFVAAQLFFLGVALAIVVVVRTLAWPLLKGMHYLIADPSLRRRRSRALIISGIVAAGLIGLLTAWPVPYATTLQGVVRLPEDSTVAAPAAGFVDRIMQASGNRVRTGEELVILADPDIEKYLKLQLLEQEETILRRHQVQFTDPVQSRLLAEQLSLIEAGITDIRRHLDGLTVKAPQDGMFVLDGNIKAPGHRIAAGMVLGYVIAPHEPIVRVAAGQADVDLVRRKTRAVSARRADALSTVISARIVREVPLADRQLPSPALGTAGGGKIVTDIGSSGGQALEKLFYFDVELNEAPDAPVLIGSRVYVRFDHGKEPVAFRFARSARQLFLSQFGI